MSHKSYRPLTTLSFRAQHWAGWTLRQGAWSAASWQRFYLQASHPGPSRVGSFCLPCRAGLGVEEVDQDWQQQGGQRRNEQGRTARPFVFHLTNVVAHAAVTALVYRLACQLEAARRLPSRPVSAAAGSCSTASSLVAKLEPFLAALLFALHPVHTEAVAGIVGHAELLCAALSIPALLCYMAAADGRVADMGSHWRHVAAAMLLGWAAALTKEIGITIVSCC